MAASIPAGTCRSTRRNLLSRCPWAVAPGLDNRPTHAYVGLITPVAPSRHPPRRDTAARTFWLTASRPSAPSQIARSNPGQLGATAASPRHEHLLRRQGVRGARVHPPASRRPHLPGILSVGLQQPTAETPRSGRQRADLRSRLLPRPTSRPREGARATPAASPATNGSPPVTSTGAASSCRANARGGSHEGEHVSGNGGRSRHTGE